MRKILIIVISCLLITTGVVSTCAILHSAPVQVVQTATSAYSDSALITKVQKKLKQWGYYTGSVDGINGPKTIAAVKKFQKKYGLTQDGIVGPLTAEKMGISLSTTSGSSSSSYNSNDLYLLAKLVYSEARGEPYVGKVAVAAVCLNRVKDSRFPNTIAGVIYQPWAFTAVQDGQFNLEPDNSAYQAAKDALNGWDPTYGCVYYYNPATATSKWIWNTKTVTTIGKHTFSV